jgi:hypothetical protein
MGSWSRDDVGRACFHWPATVGERREIVQVVSQAAPVIGTVGRKRDGLASTIVGMVFRRCLEKHRGQYLAVVGAGSTRASRVSVHTSDFYSSDMFGLMTCLCRIEAVLV